MCWSSEAVKCQDTLITLYTINFVVGHNIITDEDNWRNDYPDEEDLFHSDSDEEGLHSRTAYRYHDSYGMVIYMFIA